MSVSSPHQNPYAEKHEANFILGALVVLIYIAEATDIFVFFFLFYSF